MNKICLNCKFIKDVKVDKSNPKLINGCKTGFCGMHKIEIKDYFLNNVYCEYFTEKEVVE